MSWFDAAGFANLAKSALSNAQKRIDKVLDIAEQDRSKLVEGSSPGDSENFFASFGLTPPEKSPSSPIAPSTKCATTIITPSQNTPGMTTNVQTPAGEGFWSSFFDTVSLPVSNVSTLPSISVEQNIQSVHLSKDENMTSNISDEQKLIDSQPSETSLKDSVSLDGTSQVLEPSLMGDDDSSIAESNEPIAERLECKHFNESVETNQSNLLSLEKKEEIEEVIKEAHSQNIFEVESSPQTHTSMIQSQKGWECESLLITESMEGIFLTPEDNGRQIFDSDKTASGESSTLSSCSVEQSENSELNFLEDTLTNVSFETNAGSSLSSKEDEPANVNKQNVQNNQLEENSKLDTNSSSWTLTSQHENANNVISCESESNISVLEISKKCHEKRPSDVRIIESITSSTLSNSSSYVSHLLEDAICDTDSKIEEQEVESVASSEKSDLVKVESENSGHTSSDEIETNTSSDIEIISPNGEIGERISMSPCKQLLGKAGRHSRSDSQSSSSSNSGRHVMFEMKLSREEEFQRRPLGIYGKEKGAFHAPNKLSPFTSSTTSFLKYAHSKSDNLAINCSACPMHGTNNCKCPVAVVDDRGGPSGIHQTFENAAGFREATDKEDTETNNPLQVEKLLKKLAEMAQIIEARESKLLELSKENVELRDTNAILKQQVEQDAEREAETLDIKEITQEFTQRLGAMEKKLQIAVQERDAFKKQVVTLQQELNKRQKSEVIIEMMKEKEQQIQELMDEGEKLSKQQLDNNNKIKKLRAKLKESEEVIKTQKEKLEKQAADIDGLRKSTSRKEDMEKNQLDTIKQLNNTLQKQEKELAVTKSDLEDAQEKIRSLQVAIDSSIKEMSELHKANVTRDSQAQEAALSAEMASKEELRLTLEKYKEQSRQEQESFFQQIEDLRLSLSRADQQHNRREDNLRQEISDLQQRLQEAESRNQELTQSVSSATRPLLRQIENLQTTMASQAAAWEKLEKTLTDRLMDAQSQLAILSEKERISSEKALDLTARISAIESQYSFIRQEKSRLLAELEIERTKVEMLEDNKNKESVHRESLQHSLMEEISVLKKEKVMLENHLEMEKIRMENDRKKFLLTQEQLLEKEKKPHSDSNRSSPGPSISRVNSMSDSMATAIIPWTQDEMLEKTLMLASSNGNKTSLYESLRNGSGSSILEYLQSQLKQKDGEVIQLQNEIGELERTREAMARELVDLTGRNEELEEQMKELPELRQKYSETEQRYNAVLQMYGEKAEEAQELQLDLEDVKLMYRAQIEELLKRS